jgi:phosphoenolpyruvate-protein kinase (PTS system EI component)
MDRELLDTLGEDLDTSGMEALYNKTKNYKSVLSEASKQIFEQFNETKEQQKQELKKQNKEIQKAHRDIAENPEELWQFRRQIEVSSFNGDKQVMANYRIHQAMKALERQERKRELETPTLQDEINVPTPAGQNASLLQIYQQDILNAYEYQNRFNKLAVDRQKKNLMTFNMLSV